MAEQINLFLSLECCLFKRHVNFYVVRSYQNKKFGFLDILLKDVIV